jgi:hypothetical protein
MRALRRLVAERRERRRIRRARLPWDDLEAEAARQGCSPSDIFFDWTARPAREAPVPAQGREAA